MNVLELKPSEIKEVRTLITQLKSKYITADNELFLKRTRYYASLLPIPIQTFYHRLRADITHSGISLLRGFPHLEERQTPASWDYDTSNFPNLDIDFFGVLCSSCIGYVFGWSTQQSGKIIHDLIPQKNKGSSQTGYGSTSELLMHTEDSFHALKPEFVCMFGVKNLDLVPTTFASIRDLDISKTARDSLFNNVLELLPDESHLDKEQKLEGVTEEIENTASQLFTLYGDKDYPFMCYDPAYTDFRKTSPALLKGYEELQKEIARKTKDIAIGPGDICIIDNRKVVHGRRAFQPKFDGSDRWLKRISVTTNLRKSAEFRDGISSRVIGL